MIQGRAKLKPWASPPRLLYLALGAVLLDTGRPETGKAMLVWIDKVTCVRMYELVGRYWQERIRTLEAELTSTRHEQDEIYRRRPLRRLTSSTPRMRLPIACAPVICP